MSDSNWKNKSAVISDTAAWKEYGVHRDFILNAISNGQLDFRQGTIKGKPYVRVLRSQLEWLIAQTPEGAAYLDGVKEKQELKEIEKEVSYLNRKIGVLLTRKAVIEASRRV